MAWTRPGGLGKEIVYRRSTLALRTDLHVRPPPLAVDFVFDRQARPRIILTCPSLTMRTLNTPHKPSYWDLPIELQASLLGKQLSVAKDVAALRVEVHLGSWVSSKRIHAHIVMPLVPYYELRASKQGQPSWTASDEVMRAAYVSKTIADHAKYHRDDGRATHAVATSGVEQPAADISAFESVVFDADGSGTAAIDLTFRSAKSSEIMDMGHGELALAVTAIRDLCEALAIDGAHLLMPAPASGNAGAAGAYQERVARLVLRPDVFVRCLPLERHNNTPGRLEWFGRWKEGDPIARAYKEDMSLLGPPHPPLPTDGGSPSGCLSVAEHMMARGNFGTLGLGHDVPIARPPPPPGNGSLPLASPNARGKRKVCSFFNTSQGCRYGDNCRFLHPMP